MALATYEIIWLKRLLLYLGIKAPSTAMIYCINMSNIHECTNHIEIHYHFIRERILASDINLLQVNTRQQIADVFIKALGTDQQEEFRSRL